MTRAEADRLLERAREAGSDPFMQRMVREWEERRYGPERAARREALRQLEDELGYDPHPVIVR